MQKIAFLIKKVGNMIKNLLLYTGSIITIIMTCAFLYTAFAFMYYPKKMQNFCDSINKGDLIQHIKQQADDNNFEYSENIQSKVLISDTKTMGKSTCFVNYEENGQVSDTSYMND